jgi:multidrug transporter EmrE-like cation transporter
MSLLQWFLLGAVIACGVSGQTLLKHTLNTTPAITLENLLRGIISLICNPWMWLVLLCYAAGFIIYLFLLSHLEISRLYPTVMALSMLFVSAAGIFFLNEMVQVSKLFGLAFIIVGVYMLNYN